MSDNKSTEPPTMSKEDIAFFVRNIWESLLEPSWSRDDIIEFGKAVFAKTPLAKIPDDKFEKLLPYLSKIAESLGGRVQVKILEGQDEMIQILNSNTQVKILKIQEEARLEYARLQASSQSEIGLLQSKIAELQKNNPETLLPIDESPIESASVPPQPSANIKEQAEDGHTLVSETVHD